MNEAADNAGVIAPPPLLAAAAIVLGLALDWLEPAYLLSVLLTLTARILIGALLMAAGFGLVIPANLVFRRAGTHPEPWKPSLTLATGGVFAWMRNPMYVGGTLILLGLALALASDWTVVMTAVFALVIHFGVVRREECYLAAKFGEPYRRYMEQVPRYGLL